MDVALSRKRSRLTVDEDEDEVQRRREPSPALPPLGDALKRSKTQCELEELDVISREEAWSVDVDAILGSSTLATPGNVQVHYDLLCSALPDLYALSPSLQPFVLCHDPSTHRLPSSAPFSLPLIQAATPSNNHFVRLGLLHPLGGGKFPLDALVVLDKKGRRRLVLPFGWGAGKHADTPAGRSIQLRLMALLRSCVAMLEQEQ
ncbi:uncharacterized protein J4E78_009796 [Alternaria triticimaculans]|uniref:uncharacterized protein n=1 Tax=Alternaria triticimaculans TaxID=297637 RepID=UPI0020C2D61B|nr:uncharacterized protein J4E78_009796 [Alternaria triticimaculans]KAI4644014.1 hypothetical protein J4E78_009796 [Alternaria triticimaculans]